MTAYLNEKTPMRVFFYARVFTNHMNG